MGKYYCLSEKDANAFVGERFRVKRTLFDKYGRVYPFTNELIPKCLKLVDFKNKKSALTVLSSGDHAFNLVKEGIKNVDTFDINKLTEYYALGLKRAMITRYSYREFLSIAEILEYQRRGIADSFYSSRFDKRKDIIKQILFEAAYDMDKKYRDFWLSIIDSSNSGVLEENFIASRMFQDDFSDIVDGNNYLTNEASYNLLKSRLGSANITFKNARILEVPQRFKSKKYDIVMFSNILDYMNNTFGINWDYSKFEGFEKQVDRMCSDDSTIFYHYILSCRTLGAITNSSPVFLGSSVYSSDLKDFKIEIIKNDSFVDGVLVKKIHR